MKKQTAVIIDKEVLIRKQYELMARVNELAKEIEEKFGNDLHLIKTKEGTTGDLEEYLKLYGEYSEKEGMIKIISELLTDPEVDEKEYGLNFVEIG